MFPIILKTKGDYFRENYYQLVSVLSVTYDRAVLNIVYMIGAL